MLPGKQYSLVPLLRLDACHRRISQFSPTRATTLVGGTRSIVFSKPHSASPSSSYAPHSPSSSSAIPLPPPSQRNRPANLKAKKEGDISSVFASLSNESSQPLPSRFVNLKRSIVGAEGSESLERVYESWKVLLGVLSREVEEIKEKGNKVIPILDFKDLSTGALPERKKDEIRHRGVCIVRGVFKVNEALGFKECIREYVRRNPGTKGFPAEKPQVYELYWSPSQIKARADPRMLAVQRFFLSLWHHDRTTTSTTTTTNTTPSAQPYSLTTPLTYADRLRIRLPSDSKFALGPHVDGGGVERWEDPAYRGCYKPIFEGRWRDWDPFALGGRWGEEGEEGIRMSMYEAAGGCSVFRAWQGWLSMSSTGPGEGTLRVLPLTKPATAYWLLRPFFSPSPSSSSVHSSESQLNTPWEPTPSTPFLHGAALGKGQEMSEELHPHLRLGSSMVSVPRVEPGDVVMWMGDLIHAVESLHAGKTDSSVMYIPAAPDIPLNRTYVHQQRESFLAGLPPLDFPGGKGESEHIGRATKEMIKEAGGAEGIRAMGF